MSDRKVSWEKVRDELGRCMNAVGGIAVDKKVDVGGIVGQGGRVGFVGVNSKVPMVLAGGRKCAVGEVGVVGAAVAPDLDGIRREGGRKRERETGRRSGWGR